MYEGRGWNAEGAHTYHFNSVGHAVCFVGDFMDHNPTQAAINKYMELERVRLKDLTTDAWNYLS